nr:YbjN domain-containing protein [Kineosphaera limosa]
MWPTAAPPPPSEPTCRRPEVAGEDAPHSEEQSVSASEPPNPSTGAAHQSSDATSPSAAQVTQVVLDFAQANELEAERGERPGELVVVLPGEKKLKTVVSLLAGDRELSVSAFVVRNPDENHEEVYRYLLTRNLRMRAGNLGYAIDVSGDVYVVGALPLRAVDAGSLDLLFGAVLEASDAPFNELLALGFLTSMKREWAWRISRGESLRNLEAFRHLLEGSEADATAAETTSGDEPPQDQADGPADPDPQRGLSD